MPLNKSLESKQQDLEQSLQLTDWCELCGGSEVECPKYDTQPHYVTSQTLHTSAEKELLPLLIKYKNSYNKAFNEVDPHGNDMPPFEGQEAVMKRDDELEAEALEEIFAWVEVQASKRESELLERVITVVDGFKVDVEATRKHMESYNATETQLLNMELGADDTNSSIDDIIAYLKAQDTSSKGSNRNE